MLKIAIDSGHGLNTAGKEVPSYMGYGRIKEWTLNDKITKNLVNILAEYEGVEILRLDDPTGKKDISLKNRTDKANKWGANLLISNHHNAGIGGKSGGGLVVFRYPNSNKFTKSMQKLLYDCLIAETGLKGNRSTPLAEANFHMVRESKMPAVLIEHGFMDSHTDMKVIMRDDFALKSARGIVAFLEKQYKLNKKSTPSDGLYRVQTGAFRNKKNANALLSAAKKAGFNTYMVKVDGLYKVQVGAFSVRSNADAMARQLKANGFDVYITTEAGSPALPPAKVLGVGSRVKVKPKAKSYDGVGVADFVYKNTYTVDQLRGDRAVLDLKGLCTAFKVNDLILQ